MSLSFSQVHLFFLHLRSLAMLQRRRTTLWQVIGATLNTTFQPGQAKIMTTAEETPRHSVASMNTARRWVAVLSDDLYWSSDYITYNYIYIYMSLYVYRAAHSHSFLHAVARLFEMCHHGLDNSVQQNGPFGPQNFTAPLELATPFRWKSSFQSSSGTKPATKDHSMTAGKGGCGGSPKLTGFHACCYRKVTLTLWSRVY